MTFIANNLFFFLGYMHYFLAFFFAICTIFWPFRKNGLIKKIRLILKFMTSEPGYQTIVILILPNIAQSKGNQAMNFGH